MDIALKFQCAAWYRFIHGRVHFCRRAAHQVSPFGALCANSVLEDAEKSFVEIVACCAN